MKYKVKKTMRDRRTGELKRPGQMIDLPVDVAAKYGNRLESASVSAPERAVMPDPVPKHLGGGWYLKDGRKVRKKDLEEVD